MQLEIIVETTIGDFVVEVNMTIEEAVARAILSIEDNDNIALGYSIEASSGKILACSDRLVEP